MAFNDLAANQMVAYNQASSGGFTLKSGQTNPNTLQMMTKDMALLCIICHHYGIK
jgi:hypothetical protein